MWRTGVACLEQCILKPWLLLCFGPPLEVNLYRYQMFIQRMSHWVGRVDEPCLTRSWAIICRCVEAHPLVDIEGGDPVSRAHSDAWFVFARGLLGEAAPHIYQGLVGEFYGSVPIGHEFECKTVVTTAHRVALGGRPEQSAKTGVGLRLVWDINS
jgi:hypothetical protein